MWNFSVPLCHLGNASAIALGKKVGKAYVFDCDQEEARFVQYARG
ncbi:hypothetical protein PF003_g35513 [Phytophthora fragariae]|nr:hypothetical protein PF003_g35513 [Phytophthora fragariae]